VQQGFARAVKRIAQDVRSASRGGSGEIRQADGRTSLIADGELLDLAVFSPPYPNNIDYTEVYKIEAWLLGLIDSQDDFRRQRLATMRSHPSIRWGAAAQDLAPAISKKIEALVAPVLEAVPDDRYATGRREVITGYVRDAASVFEHLKRSLGVHGRAVYVVGNSHHGGASESVTIAADLLLAKSAEICGFEVERFIEARRLRRRGDGQFLRESVVVLKARR
jgi:hypothetical protein